jgi:hypothetical protein
VAAGAAACPAHLSRGSSRACSEVPKAKRSVGRDKRRGIAACGQVLASNDATSGRGRAIPSVTGRYLSARRAASGLRSIGMDPFVARGAPCASRRIHRIPSPGQGIDASRSARRRVIDDAGNADRIVSGWSRTNARWCRVTGRTRTQYTRRSAVRPQDSSSACRFACSSRTIPSRLATRDSTSRSTHASGESRRRSIDRRPGPGTAASTVACRRGSRSRNRRSTIRAWTASRMSAGEPS